MGPLACAQWAVVTGEWPVGLSRGSLSVLPYCWAIAVMGAPPVAPRGEENGERPPDGGRWAELEGDV